jgi:hypothetical protein
MGLYDNIKAENSQYVPQFIGSNYEEISKGAAVLDKRYRDNKDYADKIAIMSAQDQYLAKDKALKDKMTQSIYGEIDKIAGSEGNFENSSAAVSQIAKGFFTNQERMAGIENFKLAEQDRQMEAQGFDLNFGDNREDFSTIDPTTQQPRRFNLNRQKQLDQAGRMQSLVKGIASDGYLIKPNGVKVKVDDDVVTFLKTGYGDQVTRAKASKVVDELIPSYMQSQEGVQDVKILKELRGVTDDNAVAQDIRNRFMGIASPQVGSRVVGHYNAWDPSDYGGKKATMTDVISGTSPSAPMLNSYNKDITDPTDPGVEKDGDKYYQYTDLKGNPLKITQDDLTISIGGEMVDNPTLYDKDGKPLYQRKEINQAEAEKAGNAQFDYIKGAIPEAAGYFKDYKEYRAARKAAAANNANVVVQGTVVQPKQKEIYTDVVEGMRASVPVVLSGNSGPARTINEWAEELGVTAEDIKLEPVRVHTKSPSSDIEGGAIEVQVRIKDRATVQTAFMPLTNEYAAANKFVDETYKNSQFSGEDKYTQDQPFGADNNYEDNPEVPMPDGTVGKLTHYTVTVPKKNFKAGKESPYKTYVFPGVAVFDANGNFKGYNYDKDSKGKPLKYDIATWESKMQPITATRLQNVVNSGAAYNKDDITKFIPEDAN